MDKPECIPEDSAVIVPGCLLVNGKPGRMLQNRLDTAAAYLYEHSSALCIVTGGFLDGYTEAGAMKNYLIEHGIAENHILVDDNSATTYENFKNAKKLLSGQKSVVITTDKFHQYRAKFYAKNLGLEPYALPSKTPARNLLHSWLREYLAVLKAWITLR